VTQATDSVPDAAPARPAPPPRRPEASSLRLAVTLGTAGALAGLLLVFVYQATQPRIQAYKAAMLRKAVQEVLGAPERYETLYVLDGRLTADLPEGVDGSGLERIYAGYRENGERAGFAIASGAAGYQDIVRVIFGYDAVEKTVLGMKVLESKETPGLGDKIEKDMAFVEQFRGARTPLLGVKAGEGGDDPHAIDMITGATISSRTVINVINRALERYGPLMEAYIAEEPR
jgi:electron transport complex protein RnfG